jgi:thiamine-phosphate pyrophosphorylase
MTTAPRGLYLLTPDDPDTDRLLARTAPLLQHVAWLQYRNKAAGSALRREQAAALARLCATSGTPLIVNDDVSLALAVGAAGVHLGRDDGDPAEVRHRGGTALSIGVSCYDSLARAEAAATAGADYIAFGAFFPSPTKPDARKASPSLLRDAARLGLPRVAIGGITPDNAPGLVAAGADLVAAISGVYDAEDPVAAARAYAACFA